MTPPAYKSGVTSPRARAAPSSKREWRGLRQFTGAALVLGLCALPGCGRSAGPSPPSTSVSLESSVIAAERSALPPLAPGAPTYPIPPELITQPSAAPARGDRTLPAAAGLDSRTPGSKTNIAPTRGQAEVRRVLVPPHAERRFTLARRAPPPSAGNRTTPSSPFALSGAPQPGVQRSAAETPASASQSVSDNKARVPLVDDQPRVHILE